MANAGNAYATVNPIKTNIGDVVQGIEQMDFAYREEQRKIDALNKARQEKEQAKKDKLREKMMGQIPQNYDTGSSSLNEFQAKIIQQGVNRLGEIYKQLNDPSLSEDERIKLEIEAQNIDNLPDNLKVATDNFTKIIQDYKEGVNKRSYFQNPEFEKLVLNGFENYVGTLENGLPAVGFVDRNNDGTINNLDVVPYDQLQQGIGNWSFQKQFDLDAMAIDAAKKVGYEDITTDKNFKSVQEKKAKISSVESVATNLLQNPDGSPTEVALSQMKKMGIAPSEQSLKQVKDYFMQRVLANTDYIKKENVDYSAQTGRMSENRQAKKDEVEKIIAKFDNQASVDDFSPTGKQESVKIKSYQPNMISFSDNKIKFKNIQGGKSGINNGFVNGFVLRKDGDIVVTGKALIDKGQKFKVGGNELSLEELQNLASSGDENAKLALDSYSTGANYGNFVRRVSGPELSGFAKQAGYNSVDELKKELINLNKTTEETPAERIARLKKSQGLK